MTDSRTTPCIPLDWNAIGPETFVLLRDDADAAAPGGNRHYLYDKQTETGKVALFLQPFEEMYLHSNYLGSRQTGGRITYIYPFLTVSGQAIRAASADPVKSLKTDWQHLLDTPKRPTGS